jgi:hypothetical protein
MKNRSRNRESVPTMANMVITVFSLSRVRGFETETESFMLEFRSSFVVPILCACYDVVAFMIRHTDIQKRGHVSRASFFPTWKPSISFYSHNQVNRWLHSLIRASYKHPFLSRAPQVAFWSRVAWRFRSVPARLDTTAWLIHLRRLLKMSFFIIWLEWNNQTMIRE